MKKRLRLEKRVLGVRLEPDLRRYLEERAAKERRTTSNLVRLILAEVAEAAQKSA